MMAEIVGFSVMGLAIFVAGFFLGVLLGAKVAVKNYDRAFRRKSGLPPYD